MRKQFAKVELSLNLEDAFSLAVAAHRMAREYEKKAEEWNTDSAIQDDPMLLKLKARANGLRAVQETLERTFGFAVQPG